MAPCPLVHPLTVLGQHHVSPAPAPPAGQPWSLPLTFFDLVFWDFPPVQRLFFYDRADLGHDCAGLPPPGASSAQEERVSPEVAYTDGDSVRLTVAVSGDDFEDLACDHPRDTARLRPLLPPLPTHGNGSSLLSQDVLAIQKAVVDPTPPLFDRNVVRDGAGLREAFIRDHQDLAAAGDRRLDGWDLRRRPGVIVFATFRFTDELLRRLGRHVESETSARCSPYALACGAAWAGIVRARGGGDDTGGDAQFGFVTGCKPRTSPPIPSNYFGNCLGLCRVEAERSRLTAANAAAAIWSVIEGLSTEQGRALRNAREWVRGAREYAAARAVTVAGSPKLGVYAAAHFGAPWGRPRKVEIVSVERTGALALAESGRDGEGGIEVGLALPRGEMDVFRAFYRDLPLRLDPAAYRCREGKS
ncbi:hypothetical protein GUJ93_ZPchr0007g3148 [Zizania palustris]|uniref:Uncharacterized protein n=1 Tax=Zizania palustris TaxID=103762 RepID=A0A8J5SS51_ZIZPA|nr:hypothetical protein GUJ93_ZPchr0007g3148 [Zizania palustris]